MTYLNRVIESPVPQSEPLEGMVANSAGGYAYPVDDFARLRRFLVLGSEGGSYYTSERKLTLENAQAVRRCIETDGPAAVREIVGVSEERRAPRVGPALFALALAVAHGNDETKAQAFQALPRVARTGSHLHEFAGYADSMRGWGRGLRRAIAAWYAARPVTDAVYQAVKYRNRYGWTHRDLLRKVHAKAEGPLNELFAWVTQGTLPSKDPDLRLVHAFERAKTADADTLAGLIREHRMSWEMVPAEMMNRKEVWQALSEDMPVTAFIRNLATMTRLEVISPMKSARACEVLARIGTERGRVHPIGVLSALLTYRSGKGVRGQHTWEPVSQVVDALDAAFERSFAQAPQTGSRLYLGIDVSGSMGHGDVAGVPGLTPRMAAAAMAMAVARREPNHYLGRRDPPGRGSPEVPRGDGAWRPSWWWWPWCPTVSPSPTPRRRDAGRGGVRCGCTAAHRRLRRLATYWAIRWHWPGNGALVFTHVQRRYDSTMSEHGNEHFIPALSHEDAVVRGYAAQMLGIAGESEVLPYLTEALKSDYPPARRAAAETLGNLRDAVAVTGLVAALSDPDGDTRASAARSLGKMSATAAVPELRPLLADEYEGVRAGAAWALGETGDSGAGPALIPLVDDESALVRQETVRSLGKLKENGAVPQLVRALSDPDETVRARSGWALWEMRAKEAVPAFTGALNDGDNPLLEVAAEALGTLGDEHSVPPLIGALGRWNPAVQTKAARSLGQLKDQRAVPALIDALGRYEAAVRCEAARSVGELGGEQAVNGLVSALTHHDAMLVSEAARALRKLNDLRAVPGLLEILYTGGENGRSAAIRLLGDMGGAEAAPGLIRALKDPDSIMQSYAAEALGRMGASQAIPHLLAKLRGSSMTAIAPARALRQLGSRHGVPEELQDLRAPETWRRSKAAQVLGILGGPEALPALLEALGDEQRNVREAAAKGLGELGAGYGDDVRREAMPALLRVLNDDGWMVRRAAAEALGALGDKEAENVLLEALRDEAGSVRLAALRSLRQLGCELAEPYLVRAQEDWDPFVRNEAGLWQGN